MNKQEIAAFFDRCAPWWDADMVRPEAVITKILDNAAVRPGIDVLDVACGTGVLFPDYLLRQVSSVTGIDISPEMARIAAEKFPGVRVICDDVEAYAFNRQFDVVMVYNAFPHFPDPQALLARLARLVRPGGRLSIAHSMSRAALTIHHHRAQQVSIDLPEASALADMAAPWFDIDVMISDDHMYQIVGIRKPDQRAQCNSKRRKCGFERANGSLV